MIIPTWYSTSMLLFLAVSWKKHSVRPAGRRKVNAVSLLFPEERLKFTENRTTKEQRHSNLRSIVADQWESAVSFFWHLLLWPRPHLLLEKMNRWGGNGPSNKRTIRNGRTATPAGTAALKRCRHKPTFTTEVGNWGSCSPPTLRQYCQWWH